MRFLIAAVFFLIPMASSLWAGPFGLRMGMQASEFKEDLEKTDSPYTYKTTKVPTPHSKFEFYILHIHPEYGLSVIKAVSRDITTSAYGTELQSEYTDLKDRLTKAYGPHKEYDFLRTGSIWKEPRDWMMSMIKQERILGAYWSKEYKSNLKDDIAGIALTPNVLSGEKGYISLQYEFSNAEAVRSAIKAAEDDAF